MNLSDYIKNQGGTAKADCPVIAAVALKAGCKPSTLYVISLGHKKPSWKLSLEIVKATDGLVTVHDLRSDIVGPPPAAAEKAA